ncbi:MAG TPA: protein-L-isoaspartate O-methyltransferase [Spirochaetota bacterium]
MKKTLIISASVVAISCAAAFAIAGWDFNTYSSMMKSTDRNSTISEKGFKQIQVEREKAVKAVEEYLTAKFKKADPAIVKAFSELPRECYTYNYKEKVSHPEAAYTMPARPMPIGYGSALSDFLGQAYMTQMCQPKPTDVVLEIGTGSGFQISWLSKIVKEAYSIEIIQPVGEGVKKIFAPLGFKNIHTKVGDGFFGWPEVKDGFDIIIVTCAAQYVPPALLEQLKKGGRMIVPIGQPYKQGQFFYIYTKDNEGKVHSRKDVSCYFVPMTGAMMKNAPAQK